MRTTRVLAIAAASAFFPLAASAADLPSRRAPAVFVPPAPFTWTGFYFGVNAGAAFGSGGAGAGPGGLSVASAPVNTFAVTPANGGAFLNGGGGRSAGFVGGGQFGYNLQLPGGALGFAGASGVVIGFETDIQYLGLRGGGSGGGLDGSGIGLANPGGFPRVGPNGIGYGISPVGTGLATSNGNVAFFGGGRRGPGDYLGTVRGRLGYAFDRLLVFATGGLAYTGGRDTGVGGGYANGASVPPSFYTGFAARSAGAAIGPTYGNPDRVLAGYAVGGGIEYALPTSSPFNVFRAGAVTLKVEGLYVNFGRNGYGGSQVVGVTDTGAAIVANAATSRADDFGLARAGLNFKF